LELSPPLTLSPEHELSGFDCGVEVMNIWVWEYAKVAQSQNTARTFVILSGQRVVAYYSLSAAALDRKHLPSYLAIAAQHPVPVFLMGRLAVSLPFQGLGIGKSLVKDALKQTLDVRRKVAGIGLMVHTLTDDLKTFYQKQGFVMTAIKPNLLLLPFTAEN